MENQLLQSVPRGFYPFWFWNGKITKQELRWQIREMAEQGVKGFFIHLRQGMDVPYLSEPYFELVRYAIDTAVEFGMHAQLYDEYPYPSGAAGGEAVLGRPELYATRLVHQVFDVQGPVRRALAKGMVLACRAHPMVDGKVDWAPEKAVDLSGHVGVVIGEYNYWEGGLTSYNRKRFLANDPTPTLWADHLQGPHRICASVQVVVEDHKYFTHFIDPMNPVAVRRFIEVTHERYAKQLGERMGTTARLIFTDETAPGWSWLIPDAFKARYGYDLLGAMSAVADGSHPEARRVRGHLRRLQLDMFIEAFDKPVGEWCRAHGLAYVAEKTSWRLSQLKHIDVPGCEPGHTKAGRYPDVMGSLIRGNVRATASAAYFYDKQATVCECYHSMGWGATLQDIRLLMDLQVLHGIDWIAPHGFFYTTHALTKHDAPPSFFFQMPYWKQFGKLSARLEKLSKFYMEGTAPTARVLLVDPHAGTSDAEELKDYEKVMHALMAMQVEFLHVDVDILEGGVVEGGQVRIKDVACGVVVVPAMQDVEPGLVGWLERFEKGGGVVVRLENPLDVEAFKARITGVAMPALKLKAMTGSTDSLWLGTRHGNGRRVHFLVNVGAEAVDLVVDLSEGAHGGMLGGLKSVLQEVALDEGMPGRLGRSGEGWVRRLEGFEGVLLEEVAVKEEGVAPTVGVVGVDMEISFKAVNKNLLRLYQWDMFVDNEAMGVVPAVPLANQLEKAKGAVKPRWKGGFGVMTRMELGDMEVRYEAEFDCAYEGPVELVMEPGSIGGEWSIAVNYGQVLTEKDFTATDALVRGSLGVDVTKYLRPGRNCIKVTVKTARMDGGLLNALYLAGAFGVNLDKGLEGGESKGKKHPHPNPLPEGEGVKSGSGKEVHGLCKARTEGVFDEWEANKMPFYGGVLECEGGFEVDEELLASKPELLKLEWCWAFEDAVEVSVNGGPWQAVLWSPGLVKVGPEGLVLGSNRLGIRIYTTMLRAFEGERFDIAAHKQVDVGVSGRGLSDKE
jgi:hypothetical protein